MRAVYTGALKPDVPDNLDRYYDRPFDVFVSYYDTGIYRLPYEWSESHGPGRQMDWGSWLYIVDRNELSKLLYPDSRVIPIIPAESEEEYAERLPAIEMKDITKGELYGVLEAELY